LLRIPVRRISLFCGPPIRASSARAHDSFAAIAAAEIRAAAKKETRGRAAKNAGGILEAEYG
jgi:hypothetical protein